MTGRFLLCDLDGTLVDSATDLGNALNRLLAGAGRRRVELAEVKRFIGDGTRMLVARGFAATGATLPEPELDTALARFMADYSAHAMEHTRPYPGVVETLEQLKQAGWVLGLCTNKPEAPTRSLMRALDLARFFSGISAGDSAAVRKPDPGHVRDALMRIGADRARAAMVGDNEHDIAAATSAGLPSVAVTYGYAREPYPALGATRLIARFDELPTALAEIFA